MSIQNSICSPRFTNYLGTRPKCLSVFCFFAPGRADYPPATEVHTCSFCSSCHRAFHPKRARTALISQHKLYLNINELSSSRPPNGDSKGKEAGSVTLNQVELPRWLKSFEDAPDWLRGGRACRTEAAAAAGADIFDTIPPFCELGLWSCVAIGATANSVGLGERAE